MSILLQAQHIDKHFGDFHVLRDVSIDVQEGSIFGLLGPNGAGKTTLIRTLTRITAPDSGIILFKGQPLTDETRRHFGYLPEERGLYRKMRVWEQAMYLTRLKGLDKAKAIANLNGWFDRFNMQDWRNKRVEELSKGMQQKLQFVITVAHDPEILILDEPFSGFDPVNTEEIKQEILGLKKSGKTIIFSTHNMSSVEELCDDIALIHKGQNILYGATQEVRSSFRQNLYEVIFKGSKVAFANAMGYQFEIDSITETGDKLHALVRSHTDEGSRLLLKAMADHVEVLSFQEKMPSMHDVFIAQVSSPEPSSDPAQDAA
ncbi:MAG: ABC transporter ATP-binding protein [Flavobacteriales bacterium]|nr:ABC transporter ATP-binding protein [Flavobacteriales bacterium]